MVHGQMREVVLVEVENPDLRLRAQRGLDGVDSPDGVDGSSVAGDGWRSHVQVLRRSRRVRMAAAALAAALVLGASIAGVRARDRSARLAALPGVLAPVDPALREAWRTPQRGWGQFAAIGADILQVGPDFGGDSAVVRIDGVTGGQQWSVPLTELTTAGSVRCLVLGEGGRGARPLVACHLFLPATDRDSRASGRTRQLVLDAASGERVAERDLGDEGVSALAFGSDVILAEVRPDAHAQVSRQDPATGELRWTFRSSEPITPAGVDQSWLFPLVEHGVIVVHGPTTWAFSGDGAMLGVWPAVAGDRTTAGDPWLDVSHLPDGRFAVGQAKGVGGGDSPYGSVARPGEHGGFAIPGPVLTPVVDDGSVSSVLFTAVAGDSGIVATSLETGRRLWATDYDTYPGDAIVLDGRFIVVLGRQVVAFDARSGRVLWSVVVPIGNNARQLLTDGTVVLVPEFASTALDLVALD